jgi:hypothetical protein
VTNLLVEYEFRQKAILTELSHAPRGYIELLKRLSAKGLSPANFQTTMRYLQRCGRIRKASLEKRAPWVITARGQKLLEALS